MFSAIICRKPDEKTERVEGLGLLHLGIDLGEKQQMPPALKAKAAAKCICGSKTWSLNGHESLNIGATYDDGSPGPNPASSTVLRPNKANLLCLVSRG